MARGVMSGLLACALLAAAASAQDSAPAAPLAAEARADDEEARDLFEIGKGAFDEGRFDRAAKYFREAYELSHRPALLFNIGTALDRLRLDQEALDAFRQYLELVPEASNRRYVEERIRIIEAALARTQPTEADADPLAPPNQEDALETTPAAADPPREPLVPSPAETARAAEPLAPASGDPQHPHDTAPSPITARWWFWTGIGAVAVAAVAVVVAMSAGGGDGGPAQPTLLDPQTRVREL